MQQFLGILQAPLGTASRDGAFVDVWSVAGIGQDELRNSKILAWLLDCSGTHGQGDAFLRCLLDKIWERLPVGFPQASDLDSGYRTRLETYPLGNSDSRVDIDIDGAKFVLFIEVKVNASERPDQVARYRRLAHEAANGRNFGVLFLSRSLIGLDLSETEQVVAITWHDVAASVSKHLSDKAATEGDKFLRTLLSQLVQHFSKFK
jgi:hypothetical protein